MIDTRKRIAMERRVVRKLLRTAKAAGWECKGIHDGECFTKYSGEVQIIEEIFGLDECAVRFRKQIGDKTFTCSAILIFGNDGWDTISDNSTQPDFVREVMDVMDAYTDKLCA
jgi:hypothetical protein